MTINLATQLKSRADFIKNLDNEEITVEEIKDVLANWKVIDEMVMDFLVELKSRKKEGEKVIDEIVEVLVL